MTWIDQTGYSRAERGNVPPRVWAIEGRDPLRLRVHRLHGIEGSWFASSELFTDRQLEAENADDAKAEALGILLFSLRSALAVYTAAANAGVATDGKEQA